MVITNDIFQLNHNARSPVGRTRLIIHSCNAKKDVVHTMDSATTRKDS